MRSCIWCFLSVEILLLEQFILQLSTCHIQSVTNTIQALLNVIIHYISIDNLICYWKPGATSLLMRWWMESFSWCCARAEGGCTHSFTLRLQLNIFQPADHDQNILCFQSYLSFLLAPHQPREKTDCLPNSRSFWWWSCDCSFINKSVFLMYHMNRSDVLLRKTAETALIKTWMTHL